MSQTKQDSKTESNFDTSRIEILESAVQSPFSLKAFGIKVDPTKDYRWVATDRIEERRYNDGYDFVPGGKASDGTFRTKGNMVLMYRSKDRARESELRQRIRTAEQTASTREAFEQEVEKLCYKHDMNLHQYVKKGSDDN